MFVTCGQRLAESPTFFELWILDLYIPFIRHGSGLAGDQVELFFFTFHFHITVMSRLDHWIEFHYNNSYLGIYQLS
jgi:hypothetical protein